MRSKLFVPANRPDLFTKAWRYGADAVCYDLEDAVHPDGKDEARRMLADFLRMSAVPAGFLIVRVNAPDALMVRDLEAVTQPSVYAVALPKVEEPDAVRAIAAELSLWERRRGIETPIKLLLTIETPKGLRRAVDLAAAHIRVCGLQLGLADLFEPHGISRAESFAVRNAQLQIKLAAAEAGVAAYDSVFANIAAPDEFRAEAQAASRLGFAGKTCIHPSQVALANAAFTPSLNDIAHARRILDRVDGATTPAGVFVVDGRMIDAPFIEHARHVIARAHANDPNSAEQT